MKNSRLTSSGSRRQTMVADQQVRAIDVGKSNVDVAVVYRGKITGNSPVAEHDQVSEVYHVIDGAGTLVRVLTSRISNVGHPTRRAVKLLNGPGGDGTLLKMGCPTN